MNPNPFVAYLADPTDPTYATPEVDLNGWESGTGVFQIDPDTLDLGAPGLDGSWLSEAGVDDDVLASYRRGRVDSSFNLRVVMPPGSTYDALRAVVVRLNHALDRFGVWVLQPPGQADPYLIDYFPSALVSALQPGSRSLYKLFQLLTSTEGLPVVITRRPMMRGPLLVADVNLARNGTFADDANADNVPTSWAWSSTTGLAEFVFDWGYGAYRVTASASAAAGVRWLRQTITTGMVEGATYVFAFDVATLASPGKYPLPRIDWLDAGGASLGTIYGTPPPLVPGPNDGFARMFLVGLGPPGVAGVSFGVEFQAANANQPIWIRCAQYEAGTAPSTFRAGPETVTNDPTQGFGKRIWLWGAGNAPSLARVRAEPDAPIQQFTYARRSGPRDSAEAMAIIPGWRARNSTALLHGSVTAADAGAAGGTAVKLGITNDLLRSVLRQEVLASDDESALRGTWVLKAALRGDVGDAYYVQGRYGLGDVADLPRPMPVRYIDLTAPPIASNYYVVNLGLFDIPPESAGWFYELWASRDGGSGGPGTGSLYAAELWWEPADDGMAGTAYLPGTYQQGGAYTEKFNGARMVTPPDGGITNDPAGGWAFMAGAEYAPKNAMLLHDLHDAASIPAASTANLTAGVEHSFTFDMVLFTADESVSSKHGEVRVYDTTASTMVQAFGVYNVKGQAWSAVAKTLKFTPVAGHAYVVYAVNTNAVVGTVRVDDWTHSYKTPPTPGDTLTVTIQADQRRAFVSIGDTFDGDLELVPPFPLLAPGLQLFRVASADPAPPGSDNVLDDEPGTRHVPTRTLYVAVDQVPRWTS